MSDVTRDRDPVTWGGLDAALKEAEVLVEEYAGYDEGAARRRIARRIVADRARTPTGGDGGAVPPPAPAVDDLVLDATCHVRAARALEEIAWALAESRDFAETALGTGSWPHGADSALLFACLLHLGDEEGARFWFQYAAGAGSRTAARCLYLHHLARAEVETARHWKRQAQALPPDDHLPALPEIPETLEEALRASIIWTSPPITTQDLIGLCDAGRSARPPYRLPPRLRRAVTAHVWAEDPDLGEVPIPGPLVAAAVAQHARLDPLHLTEEAAHGWALDLPEAPRPGPAPRGAPSRRPVPAAMESVHRALRVLEVVNRYAGGVSLTQIARETGLHQLALARAVEQLTRSALVTPVGPDAYAAGSALRLGPGEDGRGHLRETLAWVRDAVGAAVYVARYTDGEVSITQYADGPATPLVDEWVDFRAAAHASAVGKALLAQLDDDQRRDHLSRHRLTRFTAHTLGTPGALFQQLDGRMPSAPLLDLQEYALGTLCAAVPITAGPNAECVALSIPATDPRRLRQAARILQSEAAAVLIALIVAGGAHPGPRITAPEGGNGPAGLSSGLLSPTA